MTLQFEPSLAFSFDRHIESHFIASLQRAELDSTIDFVTGIVIRRLTNERVIPAELDSNGRRVSPCMNDLILLVIFACCAETDVLPFDELDRNSPRRVYLSAIPGVATSVLLGENS